MNTYWPRASFRASRQRAYNSSIFDVQIRRKTHARDLHTDASVVAISANIEKLLARYCIGRQAHLIGHSFDVYHLELFEIGED